MKIIEKIKNLIAAFNALPKKKKIIIISSASAVLVTTITVVILLLLPKQSTGPIKIPGIVPDYPAPPLEEDAEKVEDDEGKMDAPEGGGAVGMIYSDEVSIDLSDKKVTLLFANPNRSTHNVSIQLIVQDVVLAESGLLLPSHRITSLDVKDGIDIPEGVYEKNAKIVIRFYDPNTNECTIINSEILITLTVRE